MKKLQNHSNRKAIAGICWFLKSTSHFLSLAIVICATSTLHLPLLASTSFCEVLRWSYFWKMFGVFFVKYYPKQRVLFGAESIFVTLVSKVAWKKKSGIVLKSVLSLKDYNVLDYLVSKILTEGTFWWFILDLTSILLAVGYTHINSCWLINLLQEPIDSLNSFVYHIEETWHHLNCCVWNELLIIPMYLHTR